MDEELNAVIVAESQRGEREREEEELAEATARLNMASIRQGRQTSQASLKICTEHYKPPPPKKKLLGHLSLIKHFFRATCLF